MPFGLFFCMKQIKRLASEASKPEVEQPTEIVESAAAIAQYAKLAFGIQCFIKG